MGTSLARVSRVGSGRAGCGRMSTVKSSSGLGVGGTGQFKVYYCGIRRAVALCAALILWTVITGRCCNNSFGLQVRVLRVVNDCCTGWCRWPFRFAWHFSWECDVNLVGWMKHDSYRIMLRLFLPVIHYLLDSCTQSGGVWCGFA